MTKVVNESAAAKQPYTWLEDYLERLEGKEARQEYYEHYFADEYYAAAA